jgi:hypothetical protein
VIGLKIPLPLMLAQEMASKPFSEVLLDNFSVRFFAALGLVACITLPTAMVVIALSGKPIKLEYVTPNSSWVAEINMTPTSLPSQFNPTDEHTHNDEVLIASSLVH